MGLTYNRLNLVESLPLISVECGSPPCGSVYTEAVKKLSLSTKAASLVLYQRVSTSEISWGGHLDKALFALCSRPGFTVYLRAAT